MDSVCPEIDVAQGEALDVILIRPAKDAHVACSDFCVQFSPDKRASHVQVYVNDKLVPELSMKYDDDKKQCRFRRGNATKPDKTVLSSLLLQHDESSSSSSAALSLQYKLLDSNDTVLASACAQLHFWNHSDSVVVCDIDGTITKSNARGAIATMVFEKYNDHVHHGVCQFFERLVNERKNLRVLYLTSRPIQYAQTTRKFLKTLRQESSCLPSGPLFLHSGNLATVLFSELFSKDIHEYKSDTLFRQVVLPFVAANNNDTKTVLCAGFGNSLTDVVAYEMVGIPRENIFMIDKKSRISCMDKMEEVPLKDTVQHDLHVIKMQQAYEQEEGESSSSSTTKTQHQPALLSKRRRSAVHKNVGSTYEGYHDPTLLKSALSKLERAISKPHPPSSSKALPRSNTCIF
jgi:phosphatidate phosphatase PAH1